MSQPNIFTNPPNEARKLPQMVCWVTLRRGPENRFGLRRENWSDGTFYDWSMKADAKGGAIFSAYVSHETPRLPRDDWEYLRGDDFPEREGWEVRERFLAIQDPPQALVFLQAVQRFVPFHNSMMYQQRAFTFKSFQKVQAFVRQALIQDLAEWDFALLKCFPSTARDTFNFWPTASSLIAKGVPVTYINCYSCFDVLSATLRFDKIMRSKYRFCKRADCLRPFVLGSQQNRMFCSPACAHLEAVRNSRKQSGKVK